MTSWLWAEAEATQASMALVAAWRPDTKVTDFGFIPRFPSNVWWQYRLGTLTQTPAGVEPQTQI